MKWPGKPFPNLKSLAPSSRVWNINHPQVVIRKGEAEIMKVVKQCSNEKTRVELY